MLDKVYALFRIERHEGSYLIDVYKNLTDANQDKFLYELEKHPEDISYEVEEYDLI